MLLEGFFLGLSVNIGCAFTCAPYIIPFTLSAPLSIWRTLLLFLSGRLIAYISFAILAGSAGLYFEGRINPKIFATLNILLCLWLIIFAFGRSESKNFLCHLTGTYISGKNLPFLTGIVMGLNLCPPFLLGLSKTIDYGSIIKSVLFFMGFYLGSSVWIIFLIPTALLSNINRINLIARAVTILVSLYFIITSILVLFEK